jgi:hypothetical protein
MSRVTATLKRLKAYIADLALCQMTIVKAALASYPVANSTVVSLQHYYKL